jgi:hypothetical protein
MCVEVLRRPDAAEVLIRDSKQNGLGADQPMISLSSRDFDDLLSALSKRSFSNAAAIDIIQAEAGIWHFECRRSGTVLTFDADEMQAFLLGIDAREFELQPVG